MAIGYNPRVVTDGLVLALDAGNVRSLNQIFAQGQQAYTTSGTYSWTAPNDVTSVSVVCVGGGGGNNDTSWSGGGGGGALAYANNISVTPGQSYTVEVGAAGVNGVSGVGADGGDSYFINTSTVAAGGGETEIRQSQQSTQVAGGAVIAGTGGAGGRGGLYGSGPGYSAGGGGAGGYSGAGGDGGTNNASHSVQVSAGSGGGGGGGWAIQGQVSSASGAGGGVGILGEGASGAAGIGTHSSSQTNNDNAMGGRGGSGGGDGTSNIGGNYGGGADGYGDAAGGAVRIIWGAGRSFPSTNTADVTPQSAGFNNNSWTDISGKGNNGTITGATFNSSNLGSLDFDGTNDYVQLPASSDLDFGTGNFTLEGWFNKSATTTLQVLLCSNKYYTHPYNGNWILRISSATQIAFAAYDGTSGTNLEYAEFNASTSVDTWYHFALVREGTGTNETKFYLNGVLKGSMTVSKSLIDAGTNGLRIGEESDSGPGNNFFNGKISNVKIYKGKGLTATEVLQNFNALKGRFGI